MQQTRAKIMVQVHANARRNEVVGFEEGTLRVKVSAPPVEGKANRALIALLSEVLGVSKSSIDIRKGAGSRRKLVTVEGMTQSEIANRLGKQ